MIKNCVYQYQKALEKAKKQGDIGQIKQLKNILMKQVAFVMTEYLREEIKIRCCEQRGRSAVISIRCSVKVIIRW
jgi:hypothetical protein